MTNETTIVLLHEKPHLLHGCIKLLNNEWPRSETARMRSVENSNPNLPISLLIVNRINEQEVIGHAKITRLPLDPESCWIESVIINPANRGKGLGKLLMENCEKLAIQLGFTMAVLSTHDKQEFYQKLGYEICQPVCHFGANPSHKLQVTKNHQVSSTTEKTTQQNICNAESTPPPPPLPPMQKIINLSYSSKVYMKKALCQ